MINMLAESEDITLGLTGFWQLAVTFHDAGIYPSSR
jgi:hypothetical protein